MNFLYFYNILYYLFVFRIYYIISYTHISPFILRHSPVLLILFLESLTNCRYSENISFLTYLRYLKSTVLNYYLSFSLSLALTTELVLLSLSIYFFFASPIVRFIRIENTSLSFFSTLVSLVFI